MQNITQVVELLEDKLQIILERYGFLKDENEFLRKDLINLQQQLSVKEQLLEEHEEKSETFKVAKTIQGSDDTKMTTKKINALINEIDMCIAQLSD